MVVYLHLVCWNFIIAKNIQAQVFGKFPDKNTGQMVTHRWRGTSSLGNLSRLFLWYMCPSSQPIPVPDIPNPPTSSLTHTWATQLGKMTLIQIDSVRRHCAVYFILYIVHLVVYLYLCISTVQCVHVGGGGGS